MIKNFGKVNDNLYRGGQPSEDELNDLSITYSINTVIDLRDDPKPQERGWVEQYLMTYVGLPFSDIAYPTEDWINSCLKIINDPAHWPIYIHCKGGRHRTGVICAVVRFAEGWTYERVYAEMKEYDFYTKYGHECMGQFVQEYWKFLLDSK